MAMRKSEILEWLDTIEDDPEIGIDEGGLRLVMLYEDGQESDDELEVGGIPSTDPVYDQSS